MERIGAFYPTPGYCDEEMIFYRLTGLTAASGFSLDVDEVLEPRTFGLEEAARTVAEAPVADMKTVLGLRLVRG